MEKHSPIHVFATWKVREGQIENVLHLLKDVHDESIKEEGNLFYNIHQSNTDPNIVILFEGYTGEAALTAHRNSSYFQDVVLGKIVPLLVDRTVVLTTPLDYLNSSI